MTKRIIVLAALAVIASMLAGCCLMPPTVPWNEAEERVKLVSALNGWAEGVEDFDVDAMAGEGILAAGFKLTIQETISYTKDADTLRSELNNDAALQAQWRQAPTNYRLRLDIDSGVVEGDSLFAQDDVNGWTIVSIDKTKARVVGEFEVYEWTADVSTWQSDTGTIEIDLIRTPNAWKVLSMKIKFGGVLYDTDAAAAAAKVGFGLGWGPK